MFIQSFKATIAFGLLVILGIGAYGVVIGPQWYIKAAVVLAALSYICQAISTVDAQMRDAAMVAGAHEASAMIAAANRWQTAAMAMWLVTLIAGAYVVASMVLA